MLEQSLHTIKLLNKITKNSVLPLRILPILIVDFKMNMKKPQYPFIHYLIQFFSKKLSSSTIVSYLYLVCLVLLFQINKNNTCSTVSTYYHLAGRRNENIQCVNLFHSCK